MAKKQVTSVSEQACEEGLVFPQALMMPPKSQLVRYEDAVTDRIVKFDEYARKLGAGFGITMKDFDLVPHPATRYAGQTPTFENVAATFLAALDYGPKHVSLQPLDGRWGLYYRETLPPLRQSPNRKPQLVPLKDAPLDMREQFLRVSESFFRRYLERCRSRLETMKTAVDAADETLRLLENFRLE